MRAKARRLKAEHGLHLLIIDYIQLMQGRGRFESRQAELASISRSLKGLAKELNVPIVALSQLSRAPETRSDHRPQLSDLRESGALEQDADVVMFIYREEQYRDADGQPNQEAQGMAEIIIGKQRNGPTGTAKLAFIKEHTRFENLAHGVASVIRPTVARVDLDAMRANFRAIVSLSSPRLTAPAPAIIAVVKANAYGHGAPQVGLALEEAGAAMLACADIEEGIVLRQAGVRAPILVFGALERQRSRRRLRARPHADDLDARRGARAAGRAPRPRGVTLRCHLKIDTGMNRLGFRHDNLDADAARRSRPARTSRSTRSTRTSRPPTIPDHALFGEQRERFEASIARARRRSASTPGVRHAANSAALLRDERVWYDFVRPGLLLYGVVPPPLATTLPLRPALSLHSRIVAVKGMRPGEGTGYGLKTTVDRAARRSPSCPPATPTASTCRLAGRGFMLVRGRRVPIVGSVCMDMTMIDVTGMDVAPGDEVVIVGEQGDESIGVREIAAAIGTIPYELLCRVGSRIQRVYDR